MYRFFQKVMCFILAVIMTVPSSGTTVFAANNGQPTYDYGDTVEVDPDMTGDPTTEGNTSFGVTINGDGDIVIRTRDKRRTSNTWYKTVGFHISRCKYNPAEEELHSGTTSDHTEFYLDEAHKQVDESDPESYYTITRFTYPFEEVYSLIAAVSADWATEVSDAMYNGSSCYIKFDSIMVVFDNGHLQRYLYVDKPPVDGRNPGVLRASQRAPQDKGELYNARPWANPSGIPTHFDRYLPISSPTEIPVPEDYPVTEDTNVPDTSAKGYSAGNANLQGYDASLGVPSSKTLEVYGEALPWCAENKVWARMVGATYYPVYYYRWSSHYSGSYHDASAERLLRAEGVWDLLDGDQDVYTVTKSGFSEIRDENNVGTGQYHGGTVTFKISRPLHERGYAGIKAYVAFQYLDRAKTNAYDLETMDLKNDAYGSAGLQFVSNYMTNTDASVGLEEKDFNDSTLNAVTGDYVSWADTPTKVAGKITHNFDEDLKEACEDIYNGTKTANDYLYIKDQPGEDPGPGTYLGGSQTRGVNFRGKRGANADALGHRAIGNLTANNSNGGYGYSDHWAECTESAAVKAECHPYTQGGRKFPGANAVWEKFDSQSVTIPPRTNNGKHDTYFDNENGVTYTKIGNLLPTSNGGTQIFGAGKKVNTDYIYCDTYAQFGNHVNIQSEQSNQILSYWNNALGIAGDENTKIVDPVNVHTPVIAPTVINDGDGSSQQIGGTGGENQLIHPNTGNGDGFGEDDEGAILPSELRLDGWYIIHWVDLVTNADSDQDGVEDGAEHRNIPTPDDGGYQDETLLHDQFTKDKYMKFPFEVYYDGVFYAANEWIKVVNPNEYKFTEQSDTTLTKIYRTSTSSTGWQIASYGDGSSWKKNGNVTWYDSYGATRSLNHWKDTPIYIPSWSKEGLYKEIAKSENENDPDDDRITCAQFRVHAINTYDDDSQFHYDEMKKIANNSYNMILYPVSSTGSGYAAYVALFNSAVELSGWIHDFTITGTNESELFGGISKEDVKDTQIHSDQDYSFADNKQDKKSGVLNRIGEKALRYLKDGIISKVSGSAKWLEENTVALLGGYDYNGNHIYGKSNAFPDMGTVPKGTSFSFMFRTISNLWDFTDLDSSKGDFVKLTPTYKYYKWKDSAWYTLNNPDIKAYYSENGEDFIPYGSERDENNWKETSLGIKQFRQSYYDEKDQVTNGSEVLRYADWITWNTYRYNMENPASGLPNTTTFENYKTMEEGGTLPDHCITNQEWLKTMQKNYKLSEIQAGTEDNVYLRLLSGEYDQLRINIYGNGQDTGDTMFRTYKDLLDTDVTGNAWNKVGTGSFDRNRNTGDDGYKMTLKTATLTENDWDMDTAFRNSMQAWYGSYYVPESLKLIDLNENPMFRDFSDEHSLVHSIFNSQGYVTGDQLEAAYSIGGPGGDASKGKYTDAMQYYANIKRYIDPDRDGLNEDDEVFIKDGYLIINFDIIAYKNGNEYMRYTGSNGGQWTKEGYIEVPDDEVPDDDDDAPPTDPGDVIVIDLEKKVSDKYRAGIYNIN